MKMLELNRQNHNEPEFDELFSMISDLENFFIEDADFKNSQWNENFNVILDFQDDDGSFKLFDNYKVPADARVDFCYIPTYLCTAILMKAYLTNPDSFTIKERTALQKGLEMCCVKNMRGHGYEALKGQIDALNIFFKAGLREFTDLYHEFCPEFSEMIDNIIAQFRNMEAHENFTGPWGESYEAEIKSVNEYFSKRNVFVYGTLMKGEANHGYLQNSTCSGTALVMGYDMYNVGAYPAIVSGDNLIIGELYNVPLEDMPSIDMLEGEGSLYTKKCETVSYDDGKSTFAFVYVYKGDVSNLERISSWNREYVWYVSYGSNMLKERFLCYIRGGSYEGSTPRKACSDTALPLAVKSIEIPYDMYFGNLSRSWQNGGVSFLDTSRKGKSLGVAYLITKEQLVHVATQENGGNHPRDSHGWYTDFIDLGMMDGFEVITITNRSLRSYNKPRRAYKDILIKGIKENWPDMADEDIEDYLDNCIRR